MKAISKQRSFIMGMAILWVAWFHTDLMTGVEGVDFFRQTGYGGVDVFFLLTGIGAWFSLNRKPDAPGYMKRRMLRILPSYYPFILAWLLMIKVTGELYGTEIIGNLTMLGWWHGGRNQFNWYISAIWLFYLLAPFLVVAVLRGKNKKLVTGCLILTGFFASVTFFHTQLLMAFSRIPVFILGIYMGYLLSGENGNEKKSITFFNILMVIGFAVLYGSLHYLSGYLWNYGLWWYPFFLIAPGLSLDLGLLANLLDRTKVTSFIKRAVELCGKASFEIYLIHIAVFEYAKAHWEMNGMKWLLLYFTAMIAGICYEKLIHLIKDRIIKKHSALAA